MPHALAVEEKVAASMELSLFIFLAFVNLVIVATVTILAVSWTVEDAFPALSPMERVIQFPVSIFTLIVALFLFRITVFPFLAWGWQRNRNRFWSGLELCGDKIRFFGLISQHYIESQNVYLIELCPHGEAADTKRRLVKVHDSVKSPDSSLCLPDSEARDCFNSLLCRCEHAAGNDLLSEAVISPRSPTKADMALKLLAQRELKVATLELGAGISVSIIVIALLICWIVTLGPNGIGRTIPVIIGLALLWTAAYRRRRRAKNLLSQTGDRVIQKLE
jgi:hypothetical protein